MKRLRPALSLLALALALAGPAAAQAAVTWQGPGDDFAAGANWAGGAGPGAGETAAFAGAAPLAVRLSGASASLATLDFQSPGYGLAIQGGTLTLGGLTAAQGNGRLLVGPGGTLRYEGQQIDPGAVFEWWLDSVSAGVPVTLDGGRLVNAAGILYPSWPATPGPPTYFPTGFRLELPRLEVGPGGGTIEAAEVGLRTPWLLVDALEGTGRLSIASGEVTVDSTAYAGAIAISPGARLNIGRICCEGGPVYDFLPSRFDASRITRVENDGTLVLRGQFLASDLTADMTGSGSLSLVSNARTAELRILGRLAHRGGTSLDGPPSVPLEMVFDPSNGVTFREVAQPPVSYVIGDGGTRGWVEGDIRVGRRARLVFHRGDDVTHAGAITGQGAFAQRGPGTLTLTGASAVERGVSVEGGRLVVAGSLASPGGVEVRGGTLLLTGRMSTTEVRLGAGGVFDLRGMLEASRVEVGAGGRFLANADISGLRVDVMPGGMLGGAGRLGSLTVTGMLAPGNSIGTLTLAGDLTLAPGATTQIEVEGAANDRIVAGGRAALGGTLQVIVGPGGALINTLYPVIAAQGGVSGAFARAEVNDAKLEVVTVQGAQSLGFLLRPFVFTPFLDANATPNARRAALAFDVARRAGGDGSAYAALLGAPVPAITPLANAMAGEVATAVPALGQRFAAGFLAAMLAPRGGPQGLSAWAEALGGGEHLRAGGGSAARDLRSWGIAGGLEFREAESWRAGLALSVGSGQASLSGGLGRAEGESLQAGAHAAFRSGPAELRLAGTLGFLEADTRRMLAGQRVTAQGIGSLLWGVRAEAGHAAWAGEGWRVGPVLAVQAVGADGGGFREGAAPGIAARGQARSASRWEAGMEGEARLAAAGVPLVLRARAGFADHLARGTGRFVTLNGVESGAYLVEGAPRSRQAALLSASAEATPHERLRLVASFASELSGSTTALEGRLRLAWRL